jgi:hypothetical protein
MEIHSSHVTRFSDSSLYDEKCVNCGATDSPYTQRGSRTLADPCPKPVGNGGITFEEWKRKRQKGAERIKGL